MSISIFGKKSVSSILAAFNQTLEDLAQVERESHQEAATHAQNIAELQAKHDAAIKEAATASEVSKRLLAVVSPEINTDIQSLATA